MHYAIPEQLKEEYGVSAGSSRSRWKPPSVTVSGRPPHGDN